MATQFPDDQSTTLIARGRRLLVNPSNEWSAIDNARMTKAQIMLGWVVPLAAIGPAATFIGSMTFGYSRLGFHYQPSVEMAAATAISSYVLGVVAVWGIAQIIDILAPKFGGTADSVQALKLAAFSMTAAWLAGIFGLFPSTSYLGVVGLYSIYLLNTGLPKLMRPADGKALPYTVAVVLAGFVILLVVSSAADSIGNRFAAPGSVLSIEDHN